jgi:hypothetical protein
MPKLLRLLAFLLFAVTVLANRPAAAFIPMCYDGLPKSAYADPSWQYSHQCYEGTTIWYVYIDLLGKWHLVSSTIQP